MSDPMNQRPVETPPDAIPRKSASPLIWILVLIALIALAWYAWNRHAGETGSNPMPPAATSDAMTPTPATSAEKTPTARKPAKRPTAVAKVTPSIDRDAMPIAQARPTYPPEAYRAHEEGTVLVRADVDAGGNPSAVQVAKRSGSRTLDRAATDAVAKWKFQPAMKNGKAVASTVQVPVDFRLDQQ
jgi:protein TonB